MRGKKTPPLFVYFRCKLMMYIGDKEGEVLEVDLVKPPHNTIRYDTATSIRETLVFLEVAQFPGNRRQVSPNLHQ